MLLYSILKEEKKTKGKARLTSMLRSGKELKVFTVKSDDLKKFTQKQRNTVSSIVFWQTVRTKTPMQGGCDCPCGGRIENQPHCGTLQSGKCGYGFHRNHSREKQGRQGCYARARNHNPDKAEKDKLLDALMGKPVQKEENAANPSVAKTEKSPPSEPTSKQPSKSAEGTTMTDGKPSVREELRKIKESRKEQTSDTTPAQDKSRASDRAKSSIGKTEA